MPELQALSRDLDNPMKLLCCKLFYQLSRASAKLVAWVGKGSMSGFTPCLRPLDSR